VWVLDDPPACPAVTKREKDATNKCRMVCVELPAPWTQESGSVTTHRNRSMNNRQKEEQCSVLGVDRAIRHLYELRSRTGNASTSTETEASDSSTQRRMGRASNKPREGSSHRFRSIPCWCHDRAARERRRKKKKKTRRKDEHMAAGAEHGCCRPPNRSRTGLWLDQGSARAVVFIGVVVGVRARVDEWWWSVMISQ
jgi:hypothetical protein